MKNEKYQYQVVYAQDFRNTTIDTVPVTENKPSCELIEEKGGNIGVSVGDDGIFLIDDQVDPLTDGILKAVNTISNKSVKFVINTHWHLDHVGGNEELQVTTMFTRD